VAEFHVGEPERCTESVLRGGVLLNALARWAAQYLSVVYIYRAIRYRWCLFYRRVYVALCQYCSPLLRLYYAQRIRPQPGTREDWLDRASRAIDDFVVIQVGANDGFEADPIHPFVKRDRWSGIVLEPQKRVFERELRPVYQAHPNLVLLNAALSRESGTRVIYRLAFSNDRWTTGLSSFNRSHLEKLLEAGSISDRAAMDNCTVVGDASECIHEESVQTVTFEEVLETYRLPKIDLLQVDCEGFDGEVVRMFPFHRVVPRFINFEHVHLEQSEKEQLTDWLSSLGYTYFTEVDDTFCIHHTVLEEMR
jgi:FkbM family methyltransferase